MNAVRRRIAQIHGLLTEDRERDCECDEDSYDHAASRCPHAGYIRVKRGSKELWLCGNCTLPGDKYLDDDDMNEATVSGIRKKIAAALDGAQTKKNAKGHKK